MHYARIALVAAAAASASPWTLAEAVPGKCMGFEGATLGDMLILPKANQATFLSIEIRNTDPNADPEDLTPQIEALSPNSSDPAENRLRDTPASLIKDPTSQRISLTLRIPPTTKQDATSFIAKVETPCALLVGAYTFSRSIASPATTPPLLTTSVDSEIAKPVRRKRPLPDAQSTWSASNNGGLPRLIAPASPY